MLTSMYTVLYKNQEICNKTNLLKFQLISLFLLRENSKNAFGIFVFILMARRKLIIGSYFTNYLKTITHQAEIFQGKLSTIVMCKSVNILVFWSYQCCAGALCFHPLVAISLHSYKV